MEGMIKIYGCSDDLVEIEGSSYQEDEIGCYRRNVIIRFEDGTKIRVGHSKGDIAVWFVEILENGTAYHQILVCEDENAEIYSDIFLIQSEIVSHELEERNE